MTHTLPSELYLRAYTERPGSTPVAAKPARNSLDEPSSWTLIFDTETSVDAIQQLRVGVCQLRKHGKLMREILFYDPSLSLAEVETLKAYARDHKLSLITVDQFRTDVLLKFGYRMNASIVGFNLPFDISRIAVGQSPARGSMRGGFSFKLSEWKSEPMVRVKHLSASSALIDFAKPGKQQTGRGMRNRGFEAQHNRGYFIDVKTVAVALTSRRHSLKSLAQFLDVPTQKLETEEHGGELTPAYIDYARADVQATWECFDMLADMYAEHGLTTPLHRILSEASIGKAYFKQMGVKPLLACQPDMPREGFGRIMSAYYGGRAEVRIRKHATEVSYCDFKSMYPSVNALMGLHQFVIADGYTERDSTAETKAFLERTEISDLQAQETWQHLHTLVRLCPDSDVLPVRTKYSEGRDSLTIGLNHLSSETPLWLTLADVLASKVLTGKTPVILEAVTYEPGPRQEGLQPINLFGRPEYRIDPNTEDMFTRLVDMRDEAKAKGDPLQQQIKIIANSSCYGIFVEVNRDNAPKPETLNVYGADGQVSEVMSTAIEEPGRCFNPLLATLITGAARLMLATAERLAADRGLSWAFCDTDSIAMARPDGMERDDYNARCQSVVDWFEPLNPYCKAGSILQIEDINYANNTGKSKPLFCLAISAKRYCLFNLDKSNKPQLRKASAHGLGAYMAPYSADNAPLDIPEPVESLGSMGVSCWQYDYWYKYACAVLDGHPNQLALDYHPNLKMPALRRYGATSPKLLAWMKHFNAGKPYGRQIKPFGFMVAPIAQSELFSELTCKVADPSRRGRPTKSRKPKPIAPFERDSAVAVAKCFDRETGQPVAGSELKTVADALQQFHLSPEDKFANAGPWDVGVTERRHVVAQGVTLIGKEANKVGDAGQADPVISAMVEFSTAQKGTEK